MHWINYWTCSMLSIRDLWPSTFFSQFFFLLKLKYKLTSQSSSSVGKSVVYTRKHINTTRIYQHSILVFNSIQSYFGDKKSINCIKLYLCFAFISVYTITAIECNGIMLMVCIEYNESSGGWIKWHLRRFSIINYCGKQRFWILIEVHWCGNGCDSSSFVGYSGKNMNGGIMSGCVESS